jgi:D-alanyl-D-alanine dipeptidase
MKKWMLLVIVFNGFGFQWVSHFNSTIRIPKGFVYLTDVIPNIRVDLRYLGNNNFVGEPISGYKREVVIISKAAAQALSKVQKEVAKRNLCLKVFDAYRPQKAVNHFVRWAKDLNDTANKHIYYPEIDKPDLFELNYIASKSGHSRGSTIDLSLVDSEELELDMGTPWDYFGPKSWPTDTTISKIAQQNRTYLREIMIANGFKPYEEEWWHFTLKEEPFPNTYFDFDVQ